MRRKKNKFQVIWTREKEEKKEPIGKTKKRTTRTDNTLVR